MFFWRDRPVGGSIWQRFRTAPEGFTALQEAGEGGYWAFHVVSRPERVMEIFLAMLAELPLEVNIAIEDKRAARGWAGSRCKLAALRLALEPLSALLAPHGGVEITVFTEDDQLTLNPKLELFIYSHSERWVPRLEGKGLEEQRMVRTRSWRMSSRALEPAPALSEAVAVAAAALELAPS